MTDENDPCLSFLPLEKATTPPNDLIKHIKNCFWVMHPTKGLVFYRTHSPQCNTNIEIARRFVGQDGLYPWGIVVFLPSVFIKIDPEDYV